MRLTRFCDYALRVLMYLGVHGERVATIREIAGTHRVSENHLMKVVQHLSARGYIETTRGKGGGMRLARAPGDINIGKIVREAEDDGAFVECFDPITSNCRIAPACVLKHALHDALDAFFRTLDGYTLADLVAPRPKLVRLLPRPVTTPANGVTSARNR
jgi:Rrf2 family transcriptional regulator, nitric oxide-sensitive transcriptional repressor